MEINKFNFKKCIYALRTLKYKPSYRSVEMRTIDNEYNPLGVFCDVSGLGEWFKVMTPYGEAWAYQIQRKKEKDSYCVNFPKDVAEWLGVYPKSYWQQIQVVHPTLGSQTVSSLFMNYKLTFSQIADVLEENFIRG